VPIGIYNLTANASGFTASSVKNIKLELNRNTTVNVTLQVGTVSQTVDVTDAGATIDTTTAQVQSTFTTSQIANLPIIENSVNNYGALNLSLLSSGVASNGGVGQGTGPSIGGQRPMNNNFNVEGVDNNNKTVTGPLVYIPTEATAEFTLLQNQFSPEFGHSSGGQFNLLVKSGTNEFHGSLYEMFQNRYLNAMDQATRNQGFTENPRYDMNRLGATIGGPIIKNRLFFFGSAEYAPLGEAYIPSSAVYAPTAAGYQAIASIPGISQTNFNVLKQFLPAAGSADQGTMDVLGRDIPFGTINTAGSFFNNQYVAIGSVDYNMGNNDQLRGRYIWNRTDSLDNSASLPAFWVSLPQRFHLVTVSQYHNFTPNVINEVRLGYNRFFQDYPIPDFKYPGLDKFPNIGLYYDLNLNLGPNGNAPQFTVQNTYQLVENLNWIRGSHSFKFGYDGRKVISPQHFIQRERGDYEYTSLGLFLTDALPDDYAERNVGDTTYYGDQWAHYFYANDNWRVRPNFTLNLGLRYEYTTVPFTQRAQALNSVADVPGILSFRAPKAQTNAWAPRVGFAWSPGNRQNTSIRGGFGMAYDVIFDNVGSTAYPPQLSSTVDPTSEDPYWAALDGKFLASGGVPPNFHGTGSLSAQEARAATSSYLPDQKLPYSIQWNFGIQHVFGQNYTFEARYLGSRGVHLLVQEQINKVSRVTASRNLPTYIGTKPTQAQLDALPLTLADLTATSNNKWAPAGFLSTITSFEPVGNSIYHGLALQLNRRFNNGLNYVAAYTWSHNIDDSTATHFSTVLTPRRPQDFGNLRADRADSALDRRHRFTFSGLYDTPWFKSGDNWFVKNIIGNWRVAGNYTWESPEYATVQSGVDSNLNGDAWPDRSIINLAGDAYRSSSVTALTNSAGAVVGYVADDPTARYIQAGQGAWANAGRNTLKMAGINNVDLSLAKKFNFSESKWFEIRGDASNLFNHPQFTPGAVSNIKLSSETNTRAFLITGNRDFYALSKYFPSNARSMQLVAKFVF
jgi:hypothetical protein